MDLERSQLPAARMPPGLNLVHGLLGLPGAYGAPCVDGDFVGSVAASNGLPIPFDLLLQCRLSDGASRTHAELLAREFRHKLELLDHDRHIAACLCEFVTTASTVDGDVAACIRALDAPSAPLILACDWHTGTREWPRMPRAEELVLTVPLDVAPRAVEQGLRAWRARLRPDARIVAVVGPAAAALPTVEIAEAALLRALTRGADALYLLPLVAMPASDARATPGARQMRALSALLALRDWRRMAPALYVPGGGSAPRAPHLLRLMARLPHSDVLGFGPAGSSRVNDVGFANFAAFDDYARDVSLGGFGVAAMQPMAPAAQFVEELLLSLAGGATVDVTNLARRCRCASPAFLRRCDVVLAGLAAAGALTFAAPRRVTLRAEDDAGFGMLRHAVIDLCADRAVSNVTPFNLAAQ